MIIVSCLRINLNNKYLLHRFKGRIIESAKMMKALSEAQPQAKGISTVSANLSVFHDALSDIARKIANEGVDLFASFT
jgi:hypothetical protein